MVTPADLDNHGIDVFQHVKRKNMALTASPLYRDLQAIFTNMADENFVKTGIAKLEELVWKELKWRNANTPDDELAANFKDRYATNNAAKFDAGRKAPSPYKGVLTETLETVEQAYGFGKVSYAWGTSGEAFLDNLKARRPFKDYGASKDHGDNTHRVQWFIICRYLFAGVKDAAKFYEETAYWTCDLSIGTETRKLYLWDMLCDNADNTTGWDKNKAKGRNPIYVMDLLRSDAYPLLSAFVKYRRMKDEVSKTVMFGLNDGVDYDAYGVMSKTLHRAALRFHGKPFASLTDKERKKLAKTLGQPGFTDE
ncbi:LirA/MavJ family T4SS effector [Roseateles sp. P5_E7]